MVNDPEVRAILDDLLNRDSLEIRQMACRTHGKKTTILRTISPPGAAYIHGCRCSVDQLVERALAENKWEQYP